MPTGGEDWVEVGHADPDPEVDPEWAGAWKEHTGSHAEPEFAAHVPS